MESSIGSKLSYLCYSVVCVSCTVIKMMNVMFQSAIYVNSTLEVRDILNLSLIVQQGILRCVANNSFGNGSGEIKLYITGKTWGI
jgi:hypothetical protein